MLKKMFFTNIFNALINNLKKLHLALLIISINWMNLLYFALLGSFIYEVIKNIEKGFSVDGILHILLFPVGVSILCFVFSVFLFAHSMFSIELLEFNFKRKWIEPIKILLPIFNIFVAFWLEQKFYPIASGMYKGDEEMSIYATLLFTFMTMIVYIAFLFLIVRKKGEIL